MSLRVRLGTLIIAAAAPLLAVALYDVRNDRAQGQAELRHLAAMHADMLSDELQRIIAGMEQLLVAAADSLVVINDVHCDDYMARVHKQFDFLSSFGLSNPEGEIVCLNEPFERGKLRNGDRYYFRHAAESNGFVIGEAVVGRQTGRRVLIFAYPSRDERTGSLRGVVFASLKLDWLAEQLSKKPLLPNTSVTIVDRNGSVLVHLPDNENVGDRLPDRWLKLLNATEPGVMDNNEDHLFDDIPRIVGYVPATIKSSRLFVMVGLDKNQAIKTLESASRRGVLTALIALSIGLLLTALLSRYAIRRPLGRILTVANALEAGDIKARTGLTNRDTEFGQIGMAFDHLADTLSARQSEKDAAELELKRSREQAMRESASKAQLLASASHDLRQPLQALSMTAELLAARHRNDDDAPAVGAIKRAVGNLGNMVDALAEVARLDAGTIVPKLQAVDMRALLASLKDEFAAVAARRNIALIMGPCECRVWSDPTLLGHMVRNLISNAIKFTSEGGRVELACSLEGNRVRISISDTGIGIPAEKHAEIFEEFRQLNNPERDRKKGVGLGLAIVQRLSQLLVHPLSLESQPGKGSTFCILVPRASGAQEIVPRMSISDVRLGLNVLLVEDDELVALSTQQLLLSWEATVTLAKNAEEAFAVFEGTKFDVVISDYRLPDQSGLKVIERVRARAPQVIAILVTGDASSDIERAEKAHNIQILRKPVQPVVLLSLLRGNPTQVERA